MDLHTPPAHVETVSSAAERLGLSNRRAAPGGGVFGVNGAGLEVGVTSRFVRGTAVGFVICAEGRGLPAARVTVRRTASWPNRDARVRVRTGDLLFDGVRSCFGDAVVVQALMGERERRALELVFETPGAETVEIDESSLLLRLQGFDAGADELAAAATQLARLAELTSATSGDVDTRLLANALGDGAPRVRAASAEYLFARLRAGSDEELETCSALATCERLQARVRSDALIRLRRHDPARVLPLVESLLGSEAPEVVESAVRYVGEVGDDGLRDTVIGLTDHTHDEVVVGALWALGRLGGHDAEGVLVEKLSKGRSTAVRREAIDALRAVGGVRALAALRRYERSLFEDRGLRNAARAAIGSIADRAGEPEGTLAIASHAGDLSITED